MGMWERPRFLVPWPPANGPRITTAEVDRWTPVDGLLADGRTVMFRVEEMVLPLNETRPRLGLRL